MSFRQNECNGKTRQKKSNVFCPSLNCMLFNTHTPATQWSLPFISIFTDRDCYSVFVTHHPQTLSRHTPELISPRWKCCSYLGSALRERSCLFLSGLISPAKEQQTSQVLRSCPSLLSVGFLHKVRAVSQTVLTLLLHSPHEATVPPHPEAVGSVRDLDLWAATTHLFWSWICPQCHPESLLGNYSRWTDTA